MRLLLDEHFSHRIAEAPRADGHDVPAMGAVGLNGTSDEGLLTIALEQGRVLVTNNVADFVPIEREWAAAGEMHQGIIYTGDGSVPRAVNRMGELLTWLARVLQEYPDDHALRGRSIFLSG